MTYAVDVTLLIDAATEDEAISRADEWLAEAAGIDAGEVTEITTEMKPVEVISFKSKVVA